MRRKKKQRYSVIKIFAVMILFFALLAGFITLKNQGKLQQKDKQTGTGDVATQTPEIDRSSSQYPAELLKMLDLNSEVADFVAGYPTANKKKVGKVKAVELDSNHPHFLQWDKRWGYAKYGESMIAVSGCGPVCLSMVVVGLSHQPVSPYDVAKYSEKNGYYVEGSGTSWSLMTEGAAHYGLTASELSLDQQSMQSVLENGGQIICAMGPGDFTTEGHFIVIYNYDEDGFLVHDPNSAKRSNKKWDFDTISTQIRNLWSIYNA